MRTRLLLQVSAATMLASVSLIACGQSDDAGVRSNAAPLTQGPAAAAKAVVPPGTILATIADPDGRLDVAGTDIAFMEDTSGPDQPSGGGMRRVFDRDGVPVSWAPNHPQLSKMGFSENSDFGLYMHGVMGSGGLSAGAEVWGLMKLDGTFAWTLPTDAGSVVASNAALVLAKTGEGSADYDASDTWSAFTHKGQKLWSFVISSKEDTRLGANILTTSNGDQEELRTLATGKIERVFATDTEYQAAVNADRDVNDLDVNDPDNKAPLEVLDRNADIKLVRGPTGDLVVLDAATREQKLVISAGTGSPLEGCGTHGDLLGNDRAVLFCNKGPRGDNSVIITLS